MFAYRIVLLVAGAMLVLGVCYAAFSSDEMSPERAIANGEAIRMTAEAGRDEAISRWAADRGLEFVPAPRGGEPPARVVTLEPNGTSTEPSEFEVLRQTPGRGVTIVAEPEGGPAEIVYENRKPVEPQHRRSWRKLRISSIEDLANLDIRSKHDMDRLERGDVDVDLFRLRDDINRGLIGLGAKIRSLDQTYLVPGVGGGTSNSGEMSWAPGAPVREGRGVRPARRAADRRHGDRIDRYDGRIERYGGRIERFDGRIERFDD